MLTEPRRVDNLASMANGFYTPPSKWKSKPPLSSKKWMTEDSKNKKNSPNNNFHVIHKVPSGDSPYVKAKHVQLIDKDPNKAVALFWNAINSGDHVDSALKDMAVVMKQLDRSNEAIEAIKSFRHLCTPDSQESLDNVLVELYKRSGRLEEQIEILQLKLKRLEEGNAFAGKRVKLARSQGKKVHITVEQEYARILGNLAWAYLQQNDYKTAEDYYRKALSIEADKNKQCNLAICLICRKKIVEAKFLLQVIRDSAPHGQMDESYAKSFERASLLLAETETQQAKPWPEEEKENQNRGETNRRRVDYFTDGVLLTEDSWNRTYTSPVPTRRITRTTPFTQPNRCSSFLDHGSWKQGIPHSPFSQPHKSFDFFDSGNPKPEPYRCVPRRLRFEHSWDSSDAQKESSPAPATKLSPYKLSASESGVNEQCLHRKDDTEGKKSWADMVEEDEQQKLHDFDENLFINVQSVRANAEPSKRLNRLQVFKDLTPETPKICM